MRRSIKTLAAMFAFYTPPAVFAQASELGSWRVTGYRVGGDGALFTLSPAPAGCLGGSNYGEHIRLHAADKNYDKMYASMMTAYSTGERLSGIWYLNSGPCNETNALAVYMIRMAHK